LAVAAEQTARTGASRWFYASLALLFLATAVIGFGPNSYGIVTGRLEMPPLLIHVHAAVMFSWLLLLLAQASLVATHQSRLHAQLGRVSFFLVPVMILVMATLAITTFEIGTTSNGIAIVQVRRLTLFTAFYLWAIRARRSDPESHKRMQFWATLVLLDAAVLRMPWLPNLGIQNIAVAHTYLLLLMAPAFVYDLHRFGRIHRTHWIALALMIATTVVASALW